jgi:hypothetical protein
VFCHVCTAAFGAFAEVSTIECLTKVLEVDETEYPSVLLSIDDVVQSSPPCATLIDGGDGDGDNDDDDDDGAATGGASAAAGAASDAAGGRVGMPRLKKRSRKELSAGISKKLAATLTDAHFNGLSQATSRRYTLEDLDAMEKADVVAALKELAPPKLPPLPAVAAGVPRVRQQILMRGHTSYLTFATLWLK